MQLECVTFIFLFTFVYCQMEGFIVGGNYANIKRHPHVALLNIKCVTSDKVKTSWICGASIVNQKILLTAGHCFYTCTVSSYVAINIGTDTKEGVKHTAVSFSVHEQYDSRTSNFDIALVKVAKFMQLTTKTSRVSLVNTSPYNQMGYVAGWGITDEQKQTHSPRLKYVPQRVWEHKDCLRLFKSIPPGTFCASADQPVDYASLGDSGSALVVKNYIQIGIVSYKVPQTSKNVIIYTDVSYFYNWIKYNALRLYCDART